MPRGRPRKKVVLEATELDRNVRSPREIPVDDDEEEVVMAKVQAAPKGLPADQGAKLDGIAGDIGDGDGDSIDITDSLAKDEKDEEAPKVPFVPPAVDVRPSPTDSPPNQGTLTSATSAAKVVKAGRPGKGKLEALLPAGEYIKLYKVMTNDKSSPGRLSFVGTYGADDFLGIGTLEEFIQERIVPVRGPGDYRSVLVQANGHESTRRPIIIEGEIEQEDEDMNDRHPQADPMDMATKLMDRLAQQAKQTEEAADRRRKETDDMIRRMKDDQAQEEKKMRDMFAMASGGQVNSDGTITPAQSSRGGMDPMMIFMLQNMMSDQRRANEQMMERLMHREESRVPTPTLEDIQRLIAEENRRVRRDEGRSSRFEPMAVTQLPAMEPTGPDPAVVMLGETLKGVFEMMKDMRTPSASPPAVDQMAIVKTVADMVKSMMPVPVPAAPPVDQDKLFDRAIEIARIMKGPDVPPPPVVDSMSDFMSKFPVYKDLMGLDRLTAQLDTYQQALLTRASAPPEKQQNMLSQVEELSKAVDMIKRFGEKAGFTSAGPEAPGTTELLMGALDTLVNSPIGEGLGQFMKAKAVAMQVQAQVDSSKVRQGQQQRRIQASPQQLQPPLQQRRPAAANVQQAHPQVRQGTPVPVYQQRGPAAPQQAIPLPPVAQQPKPRGRPVGVKTQPTPPAAATRKRSIPSGTMLPSPVPVLAIPPLQGRPVQQSQQGSVQAPPPVHMPQVKPVQVAGHKAPPAQQKQSLAQPQANKRPVKPPPFPPEAIKVMAEDWSQAQDEEAAARGLINTLVALATGSVPGWQLWTAKLLGEMKVKGKDFMVESAKSFTAGMVEAKSISDRIGLLTSAAFEKNRDTIWLEIQPFLPTV